MLTIEAREEIWPLNAPFRISRGSRTEAQVVFVTVSDGEHTGRGECVPIKRYKQSTASVLAQVESIKDVSDLDRDKLQGLLPPGAARNALDCALWDLESKISGKRVWELANIPLAHCSRRPDCHAEASRRQMGDAHASRSEAATTNAGDLYQVETSFTISLDAPDKMAAAAKAAANSPLLKLKLGGDDLDLRRVKAVREAAPSSRLIIDANESWSPEHYRKIIPALKKMDIELIEQPFPANADDVLESLDHPVPVCADESCHTCADLPRLKNRYEVINVKLDKTGGLTEALRLCESARQSGFKLLIGCMVCTSLGIAPARLLANVAEWIDLDGPLLLARDREHGLAYENGRIGLPSRQLWG
jgi:L-alanine-DL-glutamate epimerase-like enolase superfamily enzyme